MGQNWAGLVGAVGTACARGVGGGIAARRSIGGMSPEPGSRWAAAEPPGPSVRRPLHSADIPTLRNFTTPAPYCSATGPSACAASWLNRPSFDHSMRRKRASPRARISIAFHRPPALGIGKTLATSTMRTGAVGGIRAGVEDVDLIGVRGADPVASEQRMKNARIGVVADPKLGAQVEIAGSFRRRHQEAELRPCRRRSPRPSPSSWRLRPRSSRRECCR